MIAFLLLFVALGGCIATWSSSPRHALLIAATLLLVVGSVFYTRVEHWTMLNAVYFCVVTLGTVGYGDITPTTRLQLK
jgi:hypothetical protein